MTADTGGRAGQTNVEFVELLTLPCGVQASVISSCVPGPMVAGVRWGEEEAEAPLDVLRKAQLHEKLHPRQNSQTYRVVAKALWEQGTAYS